MIICKNRKFLEKPKISLVAHLTPTQQVSIYVRRGGPNYQEGLKVMKNCGDMLGVPMHVFGPEIHMTAIVGMALGKTPVPDSEDSGNSLKDNFLFGKHDIHRRTPQPTEPCEKRARNNEMKLGSGLCSSGEGEGVFNPVVVILNLRYFGNEKLSFPSVYDLRFTRNFCKTIERCFQESSTCPQYSTTYTTRTLPVLCTVYR